MCRQRSRADVIPFRVLLTKLFQDPENHANSKVQIVPEVVNCIAGP